MLAPPRDAPKRRWWVVVGLLIVVPVLGAALAAFTSPTGNDGNTFGADTLNPPTGLDASANGSDIDLTWTATPDTWANGYEIWRSTTSGGPYSLHDSVSGQSTTSYADVGALNGGPFHYVVRAEYLGWSSSDSNEAALGETYFVRSDGSDSNTGLSNDAGGAWLTIQKAADTMVAGDTVRVQPGTYLETVAPLNGGTSAYPIIYRADGEVTIDGSDTRCHAFDVSGTSHVVIDGFEITNQPDCGGTDSAVDIDDSDYVTIRNTVIHDTGRDAIYFKGTSNNGLVENNLIYDIDDDAATPSGDGNHTFRNNTFAGSTGGWAIEDNQSSNLFENNIFWTGSIENTGLGTYAYNTYNGGVLPGTGNISSDPLFVNATAHDYHLSQTASGQGSNSPALDAGSDTATNLGLDSRTTRTDAVTDTGTVDHGYHYDPANNNTASVTPSGSWSTMAMTYVPAAGSNRVLVFIAGTETNDGTDRDITAVSYGFQPLIQASEAVICNSLCARTEIWYLPEAGIAAAYHNDFAVTWSGGTAREEHYSAVTLTGVDQTTPLGNTGSGSATTDPVQVAAGFKAYGGDVVIAAAASGNPGTYTPEAGYTEMLDTGTWTSALATAYKAITVESTEQPSMDFDGSVNRHSIAAATFDGDSTAAVADWAQLDLTHTVASGTNRLLVLVASVENETDRDLTEVRYGNQAMTQAVEESFCTTFCNRIEVWYLRESGIAAAGTNEFAVTWSGGAHSEVEEHYAAVTLEYVDQTTATGDTSGNGGASLDPIQLAAALTVAQDDLVLVAAMAGNGATYPPPSGYTEGFDTAPYSATTAGAWKSISAAGSEQPSMDFDGSANRQVIVGVVIRTD